MEMKDDPIYCECCGRKLKEDQAVWLELNWFTGEYTDPSKNPASEEHSQGCFSFGRSCAKKILKKEK